MSESTKKPIKMQPIKKTSSKKAASSANLPIIPSKGLPVHVADLIIDPAGCIKVEFPSSPNNNIVHEFAVLLSSETLDADLKPIFQLLNETNVKGVRLQGKKSSCQMLAEKFLKRGIRPLISDISRKKNSSSLGAIAGIPVIDTLVAGIDVGQTLMYVSVPPHLDGDHVRVFDTFTSDLQAIADWLIGLGIKTIAMESTSVYWIPLYDLLENHGIKCLLANPKIVKSVPGRKTDVLDCQWLMRLLACGLITSGLIPAEPYRTLRNLVRHRQDLIERAADCINKIHKFLEQMNVKLSMVISDIKGKSGLAIIKAIVNGQHNPHELAQHADKRCKATKEEMVKGLTGTYKEETIRMMARELSLYETIHKIIIETELDIETNLKKLPDVENQEPLAQSTKQIKKKSSYNPSPYCFDLRSLLYSKFGYDLTAIPGIQESTAAIIIFEIGASMDAFPTAKHFSSWAGVCPGNKKSGGKTISGKAPKKNSRTGQALRNAAHTNVKANNSTGAHYRTLIRKGKCKKAAHKASAHRIALQVYRVIKFGEKYAEQGAEAYDQRYEERKIAAMKKTFDKMGFDVIKRTA